MAAISPSGPDCRFADPGTREGSPARSFVALIASWRAAVATAIRDTSPLERSLRLSGHSSKMYSPRQALAGFQTPHMPLSHGPSNMPGVSKSGCRTTSLRFHTLTGSPSGPGRCYSARSQQLGVSAQGATVALRIEQATASYESISLPAVPRAWQEAATSREGVARL